MKKKIRLGRLLGMEECHKEIHYVRNPLFLGWNRGKSFKKLKKRVYDRLEGWMAKSISKASRTTLVKLVVQSIPSYAMATLRLPAYFCRELDQAMMRFWWTGDSSKTRCMAWMTYGGGDSFLVGGSSQDEVL